jgi:hypothetical protein
MTDEDAVEQVDPVLESVQSEPWFADVVSGIEILAGLMEARGFPVCTVAAGEARLSVGGSIDGLMLRLSELPRDGLAFAVLSVQGQPADRAAVAEIERRMKQVNPSAFLLVLPEEFSFRSMPPQAARQFAQNVVSFLDDSELEQLGLRRTGLR